MSLLEFTATYAHRATQADSDDVGVDEDIVTLRGKVHFTIGIDPNTVQLPDFGLTLREIDGYMEDGVLKNKIGGDEGVRLPANDPAYGLERLPIVVSFDLFDEDGTSVDVPGAEFDAPDVDVSFPLRTVMPSGNPLPGNPVEWLATDNGDGTITFKFGFDNGDGTITFEE